MQDAIVPFFALLFLTAGALLLYDAFPTSDPSQTARVLGGAVFLSLGLVSLWFGVKNWWKWLILSREYRDPHFKRRGGQQAR
jgi:hypothetical protein